MNVAWTIMQQFRNSGYMTIIEMKTTSTIHHINVELM